MTSSTPNMPDDFKLLPHEELREVIQHPFRTGGDGLSSLAQLMRLTRARHSSEIGKFGPSIAALALNNTPNTSKHLRLYEVVFGRDSLRVAIDLINSYPQLARATTYALAQLQGTCDNTEREEEPGRIVHEARDYDDPIARELTERLGWGWPYYGSVDATPEFIRTLAAYIMRSSDNHSFLDTTYTDKDGNLRDMTYALDQAVDWILRRLDANAEGILEYQSVLPLGIENQVWKDSWDAYHHQDGTLANHKNGIASIEVQTTTYDALIDAAEIYKHILDRHDKAHELRVKARELRQAIFDIFWTNDKGGYFILGTDRHPQTNALRQLKVRTSNMGHVLNSRVLEDNSTDSTRIRDSLMRQLFSPELLNASGIRTLASDEYRFRTGAYHNGSVWLWDTHHIAKGMRRHGFKAEADELDRRVIRAVNTTHGYPEYVRGDNANHASVNTLTITVWDSIQRRLNTVEQPPQEVQAWSVAAILAIKRRLGKRPTQQMSHYYHHPHQAAPQARRSSSQSRPAADIHRPLQHPGA